MLKHIIIFLIRRKLGLKKCERFRFANQKSKYDYYWFTSDGLRKSDNEHILSLPSNVSLNWILDENCEIERIKKDA